MAIVSGRLSVSSNFAQAVAGVPVASGQPAPAVPSQVGANFNPGNGTGADNVDLKYSKTLALAGAAQVLDLTALTDVLGAAVNFARVRSIVIKMRGAADSATLVLGYATTTTNAWTALISNPGTITLRAFPTTSNDAVFVLTAPGATGWVVSAANKLFKLDPGAATFEVDVEITGCSA